MDDLITYIALKVNCANVTEVQLQYIEQLANDCNCLLEPSEEDCSVIAHGEPNEMNQFWQELHIYFAEREFLEKCLNK